MLMFKLFLIRAAALDIFLWAICIWSSWILRDFKMNQTWIGNNYFYLHPHILLVSWTWLIQLPEAHLIVWLVRSGWPLTSWFVDSGAVLSVCVSTSRRPFNKTIKTLNPLTQTVVFSLSCLISCARTCLHHFLLAAQNMSSDVKLWSTHKVLQLETVHRGGEVAFRKTQRADWHFTQIVVNIQLTFKGPRTQHSWVLLDGW